jgi:hypothetical protein
MATINNKYDIKSKVFFVENSQIKTGKITSIVYRSKDGKRATFNIKLQGTKKKNWFQILFNL